METLVVYKLLQLNENKNQKKNLSVNRKVKKINEFSLVC
jgi:hypothetical protein